jgi:hypothetical protein
MIRWSIFLPIIAVVFIIQSGVALGQSNREAVAGTVPAFYNWAQTPPMGWNSWDCFGAGVNELQTLENADYIVTNLKSHGWNIVTVDIQWYEPLAHTDQYRRHAALEMDEFGRLLPAANRFPSSKESHSFKALADSLHARGLKFGLHLLRGIPRQAVTKNTPVFGTPYHQSEMPYDPPSQDAWSHDATRGYASYKLADSVTTHEAWGMGIYSYFTAAPVVCDNAIETPSAPGIKVHNAATVRLGGQEGSGIAHVINGRGDAFTKTVEPVRVEEWP